MAVSPHSAVEYNSIKQYMYLHTEAWTASKYQSVKASKFQSSKASKSQSVKASKCQSHQSVKAAKSPSLTADLPQTQRERIELQTLNHAVIRAVLLLVRFSLRAHALVAADDDRLHRPVVRKVDPLLPRQATAQRVW